jgi:lipase maturation factor 1
MTRAARKRPRPEYYRTRSALLRGLGFVYLSAFWSLAVQVDGLIGSRGILPAGELLDRARHGFGSSPERFWLLPTLLWLDSSDGMLHLLCWSGVLLAMAVIIGALPGPALSLLWLFYISLAVAGQEFLGFQWDSLLLEAGLLGILLAPWGPWLGRARDQSWPFAVWLVRWLVFRLMFLSGVVKLASRDPTWWAWKALEHHYQTQPLPTWTSWYVHQLPAGFHRFSVGFMFYAELVAPFFVFGPRPIRLVGFMSLVLFQALIAATGNYGFFNVLTAVLCLALLDDRDWIWLRSRWIGIRSHGAVSTADTEVPTPSGWSSPRRAFVGVIGAVLLIATGGILIEAVWPAAPIPGEVTMLQNNLAPFRIANSYGLFAVMTTRRPEIIIEGSDDAVNWHTYGFRWKPCELDRKPRFAPFHLPRLDWQMWFAALGGNCRSQTWFLRFEQRLLEGSPEVLALLRDNPFPDRPPRYVRARLYLYQFTRWPSRNWWDRTDLGLFCPPLSLHPQEPATGSEGR